MTRDAIRTTWADYFYYYYQPLSTHLRDFGKALEPAAQRVAALPPQLAEALVAVGAVPTSIFVHVTDVLTYWQARVCAAA